MTLFIAVNLTLAAVVLLVGLLQRAAAAHRAVRRPDYPHLPLGADPRTDADLRRVLHDLEAHRDAA